MVQVNIKYKLSFKLFQFTLALGVVSEASEFFLRYFSVHFLLFNNLSPWSLMDEDLYDVPLQL